MENIDIFYIRFIKYIIIFHKIRFKKKCFKMVLKGTYEPRSFLSMFLFLILYFHLMFTPFFFLLSRNIPYNHSCHTFWFIWRHYRKFSCFRDLSCNHILINKLLSKRRRNNRVLNCIWSALGYPHTWFLVFWNGLY